MSSQQNRRNSNKRNDFNGRSSSNGSSDKVHRKKSSPQLDGSGSGNSNKKQESAPVERSLYISANLLGQVVQVQLKDGTIYEGLFHSTNAAKNFPVVLKFARKKEKTVPAVYTTRPIETLVIEPEDFYQLIAHDLSFVEDTQADVSAGGSGFLTDTDISRGEFRERELTPWRPDEDVATSWETSLNDERNSSWDQFSTNEKLFGVKTTFDEVLYTTPLDKSSDEYRRREKEAARVAEEISKQTSSGNIHISDERGQLNLEHIDEEELYGAVIRDSDSKDKKTDASGKYIPPNLRSKESSAARTPKTETPEEKEKEKEKEKETPKKSEAVAAPTEPAKAPAPEQKPTEAAATTPAATAAETPAAGTSEGAAAASATTTATPSTTEGEKPAEKKWKPMSASAKAFKPSASAKPFVPSATPPKISKTELIEALKQSTSLSSTTPPATNDQAYNGSWAGGSRPYGAEDPALHGGRPPVVGGYGAPPSPNGYPHQIPTSPTYGMKVPQPHPGYVRSPYAVTTPYPQYAYPQPYMGSPQMGGRPYDASGQYYYGAQMPGQMGYYPGGQYPPQQVPRFQQQPPPDGAAPLNPEGEGA